MQLAFFAENEGGQPKIWLHVATPAIKVKIPAGVSAAAVSAVETHYVVILILNPDTSEEAALASFFSRSNVEHQTAHFAEKFAAHIVEFIMLFVETIGVDENHLQEAVGKVLHGEREKITDAGEDFFAFAAGIGQRDQLDALGELGAAEEIFISGRCEPEVLVRLEILDVGFHQRLILGNLVVQAIFIGNDAVNNFVHGLSGRLGRDGRRRGRSGSGYCQGAKDEDGQN